MSNNPQNSPSAALEALMQKPISEITLQDLLRMENAATNKKQPHLFPIATDSSQPVGSIQWPDTGSFGMLPAGETVFDLKEGVVKFQGNETSDDIGSLSDLGVKSMKSVHMHPFFDSMSVSWKGPNTQGPIAGWMDNQHHVLTNEEMTEFTVWTELPVAGFAEFGAAPEQPPIAPDGMQNPHTRADTIEATTNSWEGFVMRPIRFNPRDRNVKQMDRARAQNVGDPIFGAKAVGSIYTNDHTILIFNRGDNPVDIRIRNAMQPPVPGVLTEDQVMIADPATGASGVKVPAQSGGQPGKASLKAKRGSIFLQVQAKSHNTDAPSRVDMAYWGLAGV